LAADSEGWEARRDSITGPIQGELFSVGLDPAALNALDRRGYVVLEAIAHAGLQSAQTHARPNAFVCIDGKTYWLKSNAQQGLVAELIAGRLAARVGAGPMAEIIRLTREALPPGGIADHLMGVVVGSEDHPGTVNARDLQPFISGGTFDAGLIDPVSGARVIVFQTWLGLGDTQVLIRIADGRVLSIDHGDCFGATGTHSDPTVVVTSIPGVPDNVGKEWKYVEPAVGLIETINDKVLLESVARVPGGEPWRSPVDRRIQIADWLAHRRGRLREVMRTWTRT